MNSKKSYLERCQEWLDNDTDITVEFLKSTIEKFEHQLEAFGYADKVVTDDLKGTIELLNDQLKALVEEPDGRPSFESDEADNTELGAVADQNPGDYVFDPSSLSPVEVYRQQLVLSEAERKARLATILANGRVSLGMPVH